MYGTCNIDALAEALLDLLSCMNSPRQDEILLREAKVSLDRALFPLLVYLGRSNSLSVKELADQVGRDPSTISRQLSKLQELGFAKSGPGKNDLRVKAASITKSGIRVIDAIVGARRRLLNELLHDWTAEERETLPKLIQKLASAMKQKRL